MAASSYALCPHTRHTSASAGTKASNLELVEEAVRMVREHGAEPATPAEMRQALAAAG
jgi:3-keto-5-aminohexanoate cleavage enzyme